MFIDNDIKNQKEITAAYMENYLSEYTVFRKMTEINLYEKEYFGNADILGEKYMLPGSCASMRCKMFEIRRFILSLGKCNEKVFLFYHYIHGESVAKCAELMDISRRSGFRLKARALEYAARRYKIYLEKSKSRKIY